jgi:hypothetical protein
MWSAKVRDDDWWHVRRLLQMLCKLSSPGDDLHSSFERRLQLLLAAIEGGSSEALLWFLPLEGVLKDISKHSMRSDYPYRDDCAKSTRARVEVFRELCASVHAVALQNTMLRTYPRRDRPNSNAPWNAQKWYAFVHGHNPRCANPCCLRLLPSPRIVTTQLSRGLFTVGTMEVRAGCRRVKSFISENREHFYTCLVDWFSRSKSRSNLDRCFHLVQWFFSCRFCMHK